MIEQKKIPKTGQHKLLPNRTLILFESLFFVLIFCHTAVGNINTKFDVGTYQYANNSHAVSGIGNPVSGYNPPAFTLSSTSYNRPSTLTQQGSPTKKLEFQYNADDRRSKTLYYENNVLAKTMYYVGGYEKEVIEGGDTNEYDYIYSPEGLSAIAVKTGGIHTLYYIHIDHLGSLRVVTTQAKAIQSRYYYDAWGARTLVVGTSITNRGFTGHEHLPEFGFINMNARLYDPVLGRFLAMDSFVQMPDYTQAFNRYSYALNNPMNYIDPSGEILWFIPVIIGIVAGAINVAANWDNIDGFWQGVVAFGVGAGAGVAACFTGGQSFWVVAGIAAGGSALTAGTNNIIAQTGKNFEGFNQIDWEQVGISSAIGGVAGFAGGSAGYWAANASFLVNGISSPIARSAIVSPIAAGAGHVAGGTTANLIAGQSLGDAFVNSFQGIEQSMAIGGIVGIATTTAVSLASGVNPLNGRAITSPKVESLINSATDINTLTDGKTQGFVQGDAQAIFQDLTKGAQHIRGNLYKLPDGTYINYHPSSTNGLPTIDINKGGVIYKIRVR